MPGKSGAEKTGIAEFRGMRYYIHCNRQLYSLDLVQDVLCYLFILSRRDAQKNKKGEGESIQKKKYVEEIKSNS